MSKGTRSVSISAAICTWNRAHLLEQTLAQMRRLIIPSGLQWELIIVNNNCTDDTLRVIDRYREFLPIRALFEPKLGLSHARNLAVAEAQGDTILWTDDDVLVDTGWLANYSNAFQHWPQAVYFGGPIHPWFAKAPPRWVARHLEIIGYIWSLVEKGDQVRPLDSTEFFFGANMAFRMEVMRKYQFDPHLGPLGSKLLRGEEIDLISTLQKAGYSGVWVGNAPVRHYLPSERLTTGYLWEFNYNAGMTRLFTPQASCGKHVLGVPRWILRWYWETRAKAWFFSPFKGRRWVEAFTEAARCKGAIDGYRARRLAEGQTRSDTRSARAQLDE